MTDIHVYLAFQDINLNAAQRGRVWDAIQAFYEAQQVMTNQPHRIWHKRFSLDGAIMIGEALFDDANLSIASFKQFLADEFDIDPSTIVDTRNDMTIVQRITPFWTFSRNSINYFRAAVFGGLGATREQSHTEVYGYIDNNRELWDAVP